MSTIPTENSTGWTNERLNEVAEEFVLRAAPSRVLVDIGAAFGVATIPALMAGAHVVANDLSADHLAKLSASLPSGLGARLRLVPGHFPSEWHLADDSVDAVLASNVLHFLRGDELRSALESIHGWLRTSGTLHIMVNSPYLAYIRAAGPVFEARLAAGERWPGQIENIHELCEPTYRDQLPAFLHVFTDTTIRDLVEGAGFSVESTEMFRRRDIPAFGMLDGRENVRLLARKVLPGFPSTGGPSRYTSPLMLSDTSQFERIRSLRIEAWRAEGVDITAGLIVADGHDDHATHWVIEDSERQIVAAARICIHNSVKDCPDAADFRHFGELSGPVASLNRLVVAASARRFGLSGLLDDVRVQYARRLGCSSVVVSAGSQRAHHLVRRGFERGAILPERAAVACEGVALRLTLRSASD